MEKENIAQNGNKFIKEITKMMQEMVSENNLRTYVIIKAVGRTDTNMEKEK